MRSAPNRSGILLVDKPAGMSSAQVTNQIKKKHAFARIGHGGTLDPFATGLLVVLVGEATKIARFLLEGDKEYEAEAELGRETDTGDFTGKVIAECEVPALALTDWQALSRKFTGKIQQKPPAFSAVKVQGKALYEYARKGEAVDAKTREVFIHSFEITEAAADSIRFRVRCSGGTYIRVLGADLAKSAGTCAHLRALRRLGSSEFRVENAIPLDRVLALSTEDLPLIPLEKGLSHLPVVECGPVEAAKVRQGNLAVFESLRKKIVKPGYFLVVEKTESGAVPVAVANHHPMLRPFCSIERVFDPSLLGA